MSSTLQVSRERRTKASAKREGPCLVPAGVIVSADQSFASQATITQSVELNDFARSIIESAPISMIATDPMGTIVAMNSAAERLTHYRRRELVGQHSLVLLHDPMEVSLHAVQLSTNWKEPISAGFQSLTAKAKRGEPDEAEWTYVCKGGNRLWVNLTLTTLRTPDGKTSGYLAMAFDITERRKLSDSMAHMAHHDQLTGLPNRVLLNDRSVQAIERAKRFGQRLAVYMVNLDHFKRFNDSLGVAGGDTLLKYVAEQLQAAVRQTDTVARVGGDEFVVLMTDFGTTSDAERCAELMQQKVATPVMVGGREIRVTASIGFCLYPDGGEDATELLRHSNAAMREAKGAGRAGHQGYSLTVKQETKDRLELEEDLRHALDNNEFTLAYQPQIDCFKGEVTGFEALLRWNGKRRGNVPPNDFIPVAEEIGLMVPISEWVFRESCFDCVDLQNETGRPLNVSVNLSPRQFNQRSLPTLVEQTLKASGLKANHLELEITEQMLMVKSSNTMETLQALRDLQVGLAIDDFGTGFSSFAYILQYHVDRIKIDQSFIAKVLVDPNAAAVVRAIIAMAHGLNMRVVAEGVETAKQYDFLVKRRCDTAQGYLLSRPVPKSQFAETANRIASMRKGGGTRSQDRVPRMLVPASSKLR